MVSPTRTRGNGRIPTNDKSSTPIYLTGSQTRVAEVSGNVCRWTFHSRRGHLLQKPPAICKDLAVLREAERLGATHVLVWDADTGTSYAAALSEFWQRGFSVSRGHGEQIALQLDFWHINGQSPRVAQRAANTNAERKAMQLDLFGGAA